MSKLLNNKFFFFCSIIFISLILFSAHASVFTYYPLKTSLNPISPPVVINYPATSGVSVNIGSNNTSANVSVQMSKTIQLIQNPDFYSNPDYWYCVPGNYLSCYWISSDIGASGGVASISGFVFFGDQAYIIQEIYMPLGSIQNIVMEARIRTAFPSPFVYYIFGLYDPDTRTWVANASGNPGRAYGNYSLTVDPTNIQPGKRYWVMEGAIISTSWIVDIRYDRITLTVTTSQYTFSNIILSINNTDTKNYYAKLFLVNVSGTVGDLSANISLENINGVTSTPISIIKGSVISTTTSTILLPPGVAGYNSMWIRISAISSTKVNTTMNLLLIYCGESEGVCVYYSINLNIDPDNIVCSRFAYVYSSEIIKLRYFYSKVLFR